MSVATGSFARPHREPCWTALSLRRLPGLSPSQHAWQSDAGSLTRSVISHCSAPFAIDVISQRTGRALPTEAAILDSAAARASWVREVYLMCGESPWVFARTLIPLRNLRGAANRLTRLGRRPLGEVLFSDPTTRRRRVEVAVLSARHQLFHAATAHLNDPPARLWGRRTLFEYGGEGILVNEIFMPAIAEHAR